MANQQHGNSNPANMASAICRFGHSRVIAYVLKSGKTKDTHKLLFCLVLPCHPCLVLDCFLSLLLLFLSSFAFVLFFFVLKLLHLSPFLLFFFLQVLINTFKYTYNNASSIRKRFRKEGCYSFQD